MVLKTRWGVLLVTGLLASCYGGQPRGALQGDWVTPIAARGAAVQVGMTRERVESLLGPGFQDPRRRQTRVYGPFGRMGQMYAVTYERGRVADVVYTDEPGDK